MTRNIALLQLEKNLSYGLQDLVMQIRSRGSILVAHKTSNLNVPFSDQVIEPHLEFRNGEGNFIKLPSVRIELSHLGVRSDERGSVLASDRLRDRGVGIYNVYSNDVGVLVLTQSGRWEYIELRVEIDRVRHRFLEPDVILHLLDDEAVRVALQEMTSEFAEDKATVGKEILRKLSTMYQSHRDRQAAKVAEMDRTLASMTVIDNILNLRNFEW